MNLSEKNLPRNKTELNKLKDIFCERFMFEKCNKQMAKTFMASSFKKKVIALFKVISYD